MTGRGSIRHNNRRFSAANVDRSRTEQNVTFCNDDLKQVYLLEEAQSITVPEIRIVDRFMHYYIPLALIVAALTALLSRNISNAIAVLVVSCPCGHMLVSSAPM